MPHSEFFCHALIGPSQGAGPIEYKGKLICWYCGSEEWSRDGFDPGSAR